MYLFLLFVAVPLIEIALFIKVGGLIGLGWTLVIVVLTAIIGTQLMRAQGAAAMNDLRKSFNDMRDPTESLAHGAMILLSGALLLTPGFFTDAIGFLLLVPPVRRAIMAHVRSHVKVQTFTAGAPSRPPYPPAENVIDGEFEEVDETPDSGRSGRSGWTGH